MTESDLLPCPFCGELPQIDKYITLIKIYCPTCATFQRSVEVFGDGHYSQWARQQQADENGMIKIAPGSNPVSDIEAFNRLAEKWNVRFDYNSQSLDLATITAQNAKLMEELVEARDLIADAIEPDATQEKADVGMVTQWDVDAIKWISKGSALTQPEKEGKE